MSEYLKHKNELYRDIAIEPNNIPENLLSACERSNREEGILINDIKRFGLPSRSYVKE